MLLRFTCIHGFVFLSYFYQTPHEQTSSSAAAAGPAPSSPAGSAVVSTSGAIPSAGQIRRKLAPEMVLQTNKSKSKPENCSLHNDKAPKHILSTCILL